MLKIFTTLYGKKKLIDESQMIDRTSAYGLILKDKQILLLNTKSTNKWWYPGGVIEKGESNEEGLIREIKEETGMLVKINKLFAEVDSYFYYDRADEAYSQHSYFYLCEIIDDNINGNLNIDEKDETEKPTWVNIDELKENDFQDYGWEIITKLKTSTQL